MASHTPGVRGVLSATLASLGGLGLLLGASPARADEPRNTTEPRVMQESGEVTNVIDAFDDGDPFDLNISLGFDYSNKSARILRETAIAQPGLTTGGYTAHTLNVAKYAETTARLSPRLDIGLYKDIALHVSLPIILSNTRSLSQIDGRATNGAATAGAPGEQLFSVPFSAPTRSGLEHIAVGLDFDILNQARDRSKPTWLFGFEGRFSVGTPMHACNDKPDAGQQKCADPSDINRNGKQEGNFESPDVTKQRSAGVTRGTIGLELHTIMSKRIKYIEPYGGFSALFEFQQSSSDYGVNLSQALVNHPPVRGTMMLGMMIIPWENREKFGRLTFDLRLAGTYNSEGRDYSELFDALGSTNAKSMRQPQFAAYKANTDFSSAACTDNDPMTVCQPRSVVDDTSNRVFNTGLTDVSAYGSFRISGSATWQVGEYVKFSFGLGYRHDQGHLLTTDAPCNPGGNSTFDNSGPCHTGDESTGLKTTGIPNPYYRATINSVGRRFWVDSSNTFDLFASGVVMF
ncbi:Hypothetical protein A7982_08489 [Minicystis rosea]|nr:Hypothetical protein A7982_08489 [Minicystis rosea]